MPKKPSLAETATRPTGRNRPASMEELIRSIQQPASEQTVQPRVTPIDNLKRGRYQPRQATDDHDVELLKLADSIRALGLIEPIAVRPLPEEEGCFEILAGDRRWRAARLAGLTEVAVIVHTVDDQTAAAMALVENLQRQNLNPMEAASGRIQAFPRPTGPAVRRIQVSDQQDFRFFVATRRSADIAQDQSVGCRPC
jgi:ParB family transcriptional regulator, chromosome partitioning protein